jgi:hypothetical protein
MEHSEGKDEERGVAILRFLCGSPCLCWLMTASFWPWWQALIYTDHLSGFMGLGKPKPSNYFVELSLPTLRWFLRGRMRQPRIMTESGIAGSQDFILGVETRFWLSETTGPHIRRVSQVLPLQSVYQFESPRYSQIWVASCLLLSSHSMSGVLLMVRGWVWLWLCYHDDYCITLPVTLTWVDVLFVYTCSSLLV